jgi:hypothetical protein
MTRESLTVAGLGEFVYDLYLYVAQMERGKPELVTEVIERQPEWKRTVIRGLRKNQLAAIVADWNTGNAGPNDVFASADQSVNEAIDGAEVATRWLVLPEEQRTKSVVQTAIDYAGVPSPMREYQSSQEALAVLEAHLDETNRDDQPSGDDHLSAGDHRDGCECADCEEFYADDQDFALGDVPELEYDREIEAVQETASNDELLSFMRTVVEAPVLPELPVTETDVRTPDGSALVTLVQSGSKLIWGRLIAVVNRRTRYLPPLLATVEFPDGVRRLVRADDILVSCEFAAA